MVSLPSSLCVIVRVLVRPPFTRRLSLLQVSGTEEATSCKKEGLSLPQNKKNLSQNRVSKHSLYCILLVRIVPIPVSKPVTHQGSGNFTNGLIKPMALDKANPMPQSGRRRKVTGLG